MLAYFISPLSFRRFFALSLTGSLEDKILNFFKAENWLQNNSETRHLVYTVSFEKSFMLSKKLLIFIQLLIWVSGSYAG